MVVIEVRALGASFAAISILACGTGAVAEFARTSVSIKVSGIFLIVAITFSGLSIARIFTNHVYFGGLFVHVANTFSAFSITIASITRRIGFVGLVGHASFISYLAGFAKLGHYALTVFVKVVAFTTITDAVRTWLAIQGFSIDVGIVEAFSTLGAG
jgi:hypothetical protein